MKSFVFILLAAVVTGEVIDIVPCDDVSNDKCTIHEVRVNPCKKISACPIKKGNDASISFDFTPQFNAQELTTEVVYQGTPWDNVNPDACQSTTCPTVAGKQQTYQASMHIGKMLPTGTFAFDWKVSDKADASNVCCFKVTVQLLKKK